MGPPSRLQVRISITLLISVLGFFLFSLRRLVRSLLGRDIVRCRIRSVCFKTASVDFMAWSKGGSL